MAPPTPMDASLIDSSLPTSRIPSWIPLCLLSWIPPCFLSWIPAEDPPPPPPPMEPSLPPPPMDPSLPTSADPLPPPPIDAIKLIGELCQKLDQERIDALVSFIEAQLRKIKTPSEAGPSSSEGWLVTVGDATELAATTIDTISAEAEKFSKSYGLKEMGSGSLKVLEGVKELHLVLIGLSVAAFAVENYISVGSTTKECRDLLLKILELAKNVTAISGKREVRDAVVTIVEGAVVCLGCLRSGKFLRFCSATTVAAQLDKTDQQVRNAGESLRLSVAKDVFLSHSGKQKDFVRYLHEKLTGEGVSCFFDEDRKSLPLAEKFPPRIFKAAETCKIAACVLSNDFIRSKWPMLELSAFFRARNSGKNANLILLPIFFRITPNELKDSPEWQEFEKSNDTRGWLDALKEVRSINGLQFRENEMKFRDEVVTAILCLLKGINPPQLLDFEPVGIEDQVEEVKAMLKMEGDQSALAVIVCGFGGVGKSTLAASVVQSLDWSSKAFKFCWVAIDQETRDKRSHIIELQKDIIHDLEGVKPDLRNPEEGRIRVKEALGKESAFLFVDNVVDKTYIQDLLPKDLCRERKTESDIKKQKLTKLRILITSREINVKAELDIKCEVHEMRPLSPLDSQRLIFKTILQGNELENKDFDEEGMINEVADACWGVPLLLTIFGKHLKMERDDGSYKESYEEALDVLRKGNLDNYPDEYANLGSKLLFVYRKIKEMEVKEAFLDICTYFHGWEWNVVADIVDIPKLQNLKRRMLVSRSGSGEVIVHDILRLMGMNEANLTTLTRFSDYEELSDALEDDLEGFDVKEVKGISLVSDNRMIRIQSAQLEAMRKSLRVLMLGDWVKLEGHCQKAFTNLRYLHVGDIVAFPFKDPSKLDKLRVFVNKSKPGMNLSNLPANLRRISHDLPNVDCDKFANLPFQNLSSLKSFIVKPWESVELPYELHLPASLLDLNLNSCRNLPKHIGHLTALESFILDRSDLESLPQGFGKLKKLKHLSMGYCSKLSFLSEELGMLSSLEALSMEDCGNLRALPESLGGLLSLQTLKLTGCINLQLLPESLGGLLSLQTLKLGGCVNLQLLPDSLGGLLSLQTLEITGCINLQLLPESFGALRIQALELHSLVKLHRLPNSFGNMPLLKDFSLRSCDSLISLPSSFVQLKMLETLNVSACTNLSVLPEDFGRLRCLKHMTVLECPLLKELPHGFRALPVLKSFYLQKCNSFVNLPRDFTESICLEELYLMQLPLISRIPDGFKKLKKLRSLEIRSCFQLKTLPDDFETLATLERLVIYECPELEGAMMEKILKLQNCYMANISYSKKLEDKWEHMLMQGETEHQIVVHSRDYWGPNEEERGRAMRVALLHGKCIEVNNGSGELMERSSLLVGLEEGMSAMVALILLPIYLQSHQHQIIQRFVEAARETADTNGSDQLQIVCARKFEIDAERATAREEEERAEEEEGIRQILGSLPKGSCAIPSSESKRVKILTEGCKWVLNKLEFLMADVGIDVEGRKRFEKLKFTSERELSENVVREPPPSETRKPKNKENDSIQNFIESICRRYRLQSQSQDVAAAGQSKTREFVEALKANGIHSLFIPGNTSTVMVDDLDGKTIGFIICELEYLERRKLEQIYKGLQHKDSNFLWIWIPLAWPEDLGHGTYTKFIQCMPWATFPHPPLINIKSEDPRFVLINEHGQIANRNAWPLLMGWGVESHPFTPYIIPESFSLMKSESCLEFLLHGMNIVGRKPMRSKMTFLYAQHPHEWLKMKSQELTQIDVCWDIRECLKMKSKLEELTQINGSFEVLYVANFYEKDFCNTEYEDATQNMLWPSLSFSDMITFWCRCKYLAKEKVYELNKKSNIMIETLHGVTKQLYSPLTLLVVVDNGGLVTRHGEDVLQMIFESSEGVSEGVMEDGLMKMVKDELMKSLSGGECSRVVKTFFRDEIDNHPLHPQHRLTVKSRFYEEYRCDVCSCDGSGDGGRSYWCRKCEWEMCGSCWREYAKQQVEQVVPFTL